MTDGRRVCRGAALLDAPKCPSACGGLPDWPSPRLAPQRTSHPAAGLLSLWTSKRRSPVVCARGMLACMADYDPLDLDGPVEGYDPLDLGEATAHSSRITAAQQRTDERKRLCVLTLASTGNVTSACTAAGWARSTYYHHRKADPEFKALTGEALEVACDMLELQARRLAVQGVKEPVYQGGVLVGHKTKYSERMLEILLKAHRPDKYRENMKLEADVKGGVLVVPGVQASADDWEAAARAQQAEHRANEGENE